MVNNDSFFKIQIMNVIFYTMNIFQRKYIPTFCKQSLPFWLKIWMEPLTCLALKLKGSKVLCFLFSLSFVGSNDLSESIIFFGFFITLSQQFTLRSNQPISHSTHRTIDMSDESAETKTMRFYSPICYLLMMISPTFTVVIPVGD